MTAYRYKGFLTLSENIITLGKDAFTGIVANEYVVPAHIKNITGQVFSTFPMIYIPTTVENITDSVTTNSVTKIYVPFANEDSRPNGWVGNWYGSGFVTYDSSGMPYSENGYYYSIESSSATLLSYTGANVLMEIPAQVIVNGKDYPVKKIADSALNNNEVYSISIPDSVVEIGSGNFIGNNLSAVYISGNSITTFGEGNFAGSFCTLFLSAAEDPGFVSKISPNFNGEILYNCSVKPFIKGDYLYGIDQGNAIALKYVSTQNKNTTVPNIVSHNDTQYEVKEIGIKCLHKTNLMTMVISDGIESIPKELFKGLYTLQFIYISSTLKVVGQDALSVYCNVLFGNTQEYYESITNISGLKKKYFNAKPPALIDGVYYAIIDNEVKVICHDNTTGSIVIKSNVEIDNKTYVVREIMSNAFASNNVVTDVVIMEGITIVGDSAFYWCSDLQSVKLPSTLQTIGGSAFENASIFKEVIIPAGVVNIGSYAFGYCEKLTIYCERTEVPPATWESYWNENKLVYLYSEMQPNQTAPSGIAYWYYDTDGNKAFWNAV